MDPSQSFLEPSHIFSVWYPKLCHIMKCTPIPFLKPLEIEHQTTLKFLGDDFSVDEWILIAHALASDKSLQVLCIKSELMDCPFLDDVDSEGKARRIERQFGWLWTAYILKLLTVSISFSIRQTEALTFLELDGLPMLPQYLEDILKALRKNRTVIHISFANCAITDAGCETVCEHLRYSPNIEILNISGCQLRSKSGKYLADLMQHQSFERYCGEGDWSYSRRIRSSRKNDMRGLKRIIINDNADFGDEGFEYILDELEKNVWIKALNLQRCGVTEKLTSKIIKIVSSPTPLEIVDLRQNDRMNANTIRKIQQLLQQKQDIGFQQEFDWLTFSVNIIVTYLIDLFSFCYDKLMNH